MEHLCLRARASVFRSNVTLGKIRDAMAYQAPCTWSAQDVLEFSQWLEFWPFTAWREPSLTIRRQRKPFLKARDKRWCAVRSMLRASNLRRASGSIRRRVR